MLDPSAPLSQREPAVSPRNDDDVPLDAFAWSRGIVGMGFFPSEVLLPPEWTWQP
jgi:hypothetical protein